MDTTCPNPHDRACPQYKKTNFLLPGLCPTHKRELEEEEKGSSQDKGYDADVETDYGT
jgi:hypothetical protein